MLIIKNPTTAQFLRMMKATKHDVVKGIIAADGTIFIRDGDCIHCQIATASGVEYYRTFTIMDLYYNGVYSLCQDEHYPTLRFLHFLTIELPISGIQSPKPSNPRKRHSNVH